MKQKLITDLQVGDRLNAWGCCVVTAPTEYDGRVWWIKVKFEDGDIDWLPQTKLRTINVVG